MKRLPLLFVVSILLFSPAAFAQLDAQHKERVTKIMQRLIAGDSLPVKLIKATPAMMLLPHHHDYLYHTTRNRDAIVDSVRMRVIVNDSLMSIEFDEQHRIEGQYKIVFYYSVNSQSALDWAYCGGAGLDSITRRYKYDMNDNTVYDKDTKEYKHKIENDKRSFTFYSLKLILTVDELYGMLFK